MKAIKDFLEMWERHYCEAESLPDSELQDQMHVIYCTDEFS